MWQEPKLAALEPANDHTDFIEAARRRKPTTAAAEIQQNLFPPRIVRIQGAQLAGALLPSYEVGGDWLDFVDNRDGAWLAIADSAGTGPTAAGLGAAALGARRAARRSGHTLEQALLAMHQTVGRLGNPDYVSALVAPWRPATRTLTWVNCGHPPAHLAETDGTLTELHSPEHPARGVGDDEAAFTATDRELHSAGASSSSRTASPAGAPKAAAPSVKASGARWQTSRTRRRAAPRWRCCRR